MPLPRIPIVVELGSDRRERLGVHGNDPPSPGVDDVLGETTVRVRDHGRPASEGLERDERACVLTSRRDDDDTRLADDLIELVVRDVARDVNVRKAGRFSPHVILEHA